MPLVARKLQKTYDTPRGPIVAVDSIDIDVVPGEIVAVCGRSGSGKSTFLGMLGGLCRPSQGTVEVDGADLWSLPPGELARLRSRQFGFIFQSPGLLSNLRASDNVALPALLAGLGWRESYDRARGLLEQVGLAARWDAYPGELSGGQARRVAVARALMNRPAIVLADEPTSDLDEKSERELRTLLRDVVRRDGTTLIVVTHDTRMADEADRVVTLSGGRVVTSDVCRSPAAIAPAASSIVTIEDSNYEPEPSAALLAPAEPTSMGNRLPGFLTGFFLWALVVAAGIYALNAGAALVQRRAIVSRADGRQKSAELALQKLRANVDDVIYRPDGGYELRLFLENYDAAAPLHVLGPSVKISVQVNHAWMQVPAQPLGHADGTIYEITDRQTFSFAFRTDLERFDELVPGYLHVRISNVMFVSDRPESGEDVYQRNDEYYIYLRPQTLSEDDVRQRNGWAPASVVPRWIGMPAH